MEVINIILLISSAYGVFLQTLNINKPLATAYYLKEDLKQLWLQKNLAAAKRFLGSWAAKAIASGIQLMVKFAHSLLAHRTGIFSWFEHKISTGPLEGMNNKIKVLKRKAYGYRDMQYFKLKIFNLHHANPVRSSCKENVQR